MYWVSGASEAGRQAHRSSRLTNYIHRKAFSGNLWILEFSCTVLCLARRRVMFVMCVCECVPLPSRNPTTLLSHAETIKPGECVGCNQGATRAITIPATLPNPPQREMNARPREKIYYCNLEQNKREYEKLL